MGVGHASHGVPDQVLADFYTRRARHGVGLIITSATFVDHPAAANHPLLPMLAGPETVATWQRVVDQVHDEGGRIFVQLTHAGADRVAEESPNPGS